MQPFFKNYFIKNLKIDENNYATYTYEKYHRFKII